MIFESKQGRRAILAKVVVDASGDLDVVAQAGGAFVTDTRQDGAGGNVQHTINTAFTWTGVDMRRWLEFKRGDPAARHALMNRGRELLPCLAPRVGLAPRALDVAELREELRRQGAFLHARLGGLGGPGPQA